MVPSRSPKNMRTLLKLIPFFGERFSTLTTPEKANPELAAHPPKFPSIVIVRKSMAGFGGSVYVNSASKFFPSSDVAVRLTPTGPTRERGSSGTLTVTTVMVPTGCGAGLPTVTVVGYPPQVTTGRSADFRRLDTWIETASPPDPGLRLPAGGMMLRSSAPTYLKLNETDVCASGRFASPTSTEMATKPSASVGEAGCTNESTKTRPFGVDGRYSVDSSILVRFARETAPLGARKATIPRCALLNTWKRLTSPAPRRVPDPSKSSTNAFTLSPPLMGPSAVERPRVSALGYAK
mmetsp:Transcript_14661/g.33931  ORF Transcript_14661/g.33931 Transcript_14661/m.33931 type:complete len:293 (-) Transcript_14661:740-1618(-)